jgi:hypothetical protein
VKKPLIDTAYLAMSWGLRMVVAKIIICLLAVSETKVMAPVCAEEQKKGKIMTGFGDTLDMQAV